MRLQSREEGKSWNFNAIQIRETRLHLSLMTPLAKTLKKPKIRYMSSM